MHAREFLRLRREGAVCDHDSGRTIVGALRCHDLLHRVVADSHIPAKLRLDDLFRIIANNDEVASLIPRPSRELGGVTGALVEPLYERLEFISVEVIEAPGGAAVYRFEREVPFALVDKPAEYAVEILLADVSQYHLADTQDALP